MILRNPRGKSSKKILRSKDGVRAAARTPIYLQILSLFLHISHKRSLKAVGYWIEIIPLTVYQVPVCIHSSHCTVGNIVEEVYLPVFIGKPSCLHISVRVKMIPFGLSLIGKLEPSVFRPGSVRIPVPPAYMIQDPCSFLTGRSAGAGAAGASSA